MPDIMFTCIASVRLNSVLEPERKVLLAEKIDSSETEVVTAHKQFRYTFQNQMHFALDVVRNYAADVIRAGEPEIFLAAPASDFFFKRLQLLIFSQAAPATGIYFRAAPAPRGQKYPAPAPDYWLSLAKCCFPRKLVR